jgi:hypothetical protein
MVEIVNLRQARKARDRAGAEAAAAAANRAKFGRTKTEKQVEAARAELARKALEGHKREPE